MRSFLCPRCIGGRLFPESDIGESSYVCVNCGYRQVVSFDPRSVLLAKADTADVSRIPKKARGRRSIESSAFASLLNDLEISPITMWHGRL